MPVTYKTLAKRPNTVLRLTGLKVEEFNKIFRVIKPIYKQERLKKNIIISDKTNFML
jgi:hypothetical protein